MESAIRAYKFYSARWGLEALYRQRLKLTTNQDVNDPFEFLARAGDRRSRKRAQDLRNQIFSKHGMISFSEGWEQPLLWSHYADNHRGVALGFDLPPKTWWRVRYLNERVAQPADVAEEKIFGARLRFESAIIITKSKAWAYEREVRLFPSLQGSICENGRYFRLFEDVGDLREVIIGSEYSSGMNKALHSELDGRGVRIRTARLAFKSFRVVEQRSARQKKLL